jgi:hypothetical protein
MGEFSIDKYMQYLGIYVPNFTLFLHSMDTAGFILKEVTFFNLMMSLMRDMSWKVEELKHIS